MTDIYPAENPAGAGRVPEGLTTMTDTTTEIPIPDEAQEAATAAVMDVRDASPRLPDDANSDDVAVAALRAGAPLILAAELERLAVEYRRQFDRQRERTNRLERDDAAMWQIEGSVASQQELGAFVRTLETRAAVLRAAKEGN